MGVGLAIVERLRKGTKRQPSIWSAMPNGRANAKKLLALLEFVNTICCGWRRFSWSSTTTGWGDQKIAEKSSWSSPLTCVLGSRDPLPVPRDNIAPTKTIVAVRVIGARRPFLSLWERFCTIVAANPNELIAPIHNGNRLWLYRRMPTPLFSSTEPRCRYSVTNGRACLGFVTL